MVCQSIAAGQDFGAKGTKKLNPIQQELITEKNDRLAACVKKAGSFGTVFLGKQTKSVERSSLTWCSMPSASRRAISGLTPTPTRNFRLSDVARGFPAPASLLLPLKTRHARGSFQSAPGCQPLKHFSHRRLRNSQTSSHVHLTSFPHFPDQVRNQLNVIINKSRRCASLTWRNPSTCSSTFTNCVTFFAVGVPARRLIVLPHYGDAYIAFSFRAHIVNQSCEGTKN